MSNFKLSSQKKSNFKLEVNKDTVIIRICKCYLPPNGDYGLNGYIPNMKYKVRYMGKGKNGRPYVRVYKKYDIDKKDSNKKMNTNHYDVVSVFNYQYYFKTFGIDEMRSKPPSRSKRK